ncbi:hypothetical protein V8G54_028755 [Vigna mungo]|uniref:Uncharacterized protein n=1 Tax=Vigna mungo TaxID=3915 RepID=A0AAQ3MTJ5_VIGMU
MKTINKNLGRPICLVCVFTEAHLLWDSRRWCEAAMRVWCWRHLLDMKTKKGLLSFEGKEFDGMLYSVTKDEYLVPLQQGKSNAGVFDSKSVYSVVLRDQSLYSCVSSSPSIMHQHVQFWRDVHSVPAMFIRFLARALARAVVYSSFKILPRLDHAMTVMKVKDDCIQAQRDEAEVALESLKHNEYMQQPNPLFYLCCRYVKVLELGEVVVKLVQLIVNLCGALVKVVKERAGWLMASDGGESVLRRSFFLCVGIAFINLCERLRTIGYVKDVIQSIVEEQQTLSQCVDGIISLESEFLIQPSRNEVHPYVLSNSCFYSYFMDCLGAIDETHVRVRVPKLYASRYWGRKE